MTTNLTPREVQVLEFIEQYLATHGYPPTIREIGATYGAKSSNAPADVLESLERKGAITRDAKKARTIRIVKRDAA